MFRLVIDKEVPAGAIIGSKNISIRNGIVKATDVNGVLKVCRGRSACFNKEGKLVVDGQEVVENDPRLINPSSEAKAANANAKAVASNENQSTKMDSSIKSSQDKPKTEDNESVVHAPGGPSI